MKKCLIIGNQECNAIVKDIEFDGDIISCDGSFFNKENIICVYRIPEFINKISKIPEDTKIIIATSFFQKKNKIPEEFHSRVEFINCENLLGGSIFALEWAVKNNYDTIYTAGIDFNEKDTNNNFRNKIKDLVFEWLNKDINIYKVNKNSSLPVETKFPQ